MSLSCKIIKVVAGVLLVGLAGCGQSPHPAAPAKKAPTQASQQWSSIANGFIEDYLQAQPFFAAQSGRHEFDGQLPDLSPHGIKREIASLHDSRAQIAAVDPAPLEPRERFDREYLLSVIDKDLFWLEKARYPFSNPYFYLNNLDPDMYLSRNYAPLDVRMKAYIKYARAIPKMVADMQENLKGPLPKTYVELGIADFGGFADFYTKAVAPIFAAVSDPELQKQLTDADTNAATAMTNLKNYLIGLRKTATDNFPLGKDLFAEMVKDTERVDLPVGAQQPSAQGRVRGLFAEGQCRRVHRQSVGEQAEGQPRGSRTRATGGTEEVRSGPQCGEHSRQRRSIGCRSPGVQSIERRVHSGAGPVR